MALVLRLGEKQKRISSASAFLTILEYLWVIFVILNGNTVYHANANVNFHLLEIAVGLTIALLVANFTLYNIHPTKLNALVAVVLTLYTTIYMNARQTQMTASIFMEMFVLGAPMAYLLFAELYRQGRLFKLFYRFVDVICVLSVVSLFFWIFGELLGLIPHNGYMELNWGSFDVIEGYYGIHFAFQLDTTFFPEAYIFRNSGIFAEAPMFNMWLNITLAIELFLKPKASKWRVILLAITIVTTLSVTGILFMVLCLTLVIIRDYRKLSWRQKGLVWSGLTFLVPTMIILVMKVFVLKTETQSYDMRLSDYVGGVKLWMDYPIFGCGYGNLGMLQDYIYSPNGIIGFSNSVTAVLGTGGAWMAVLFYLPLFGILSPRVSGSGKLSCFGLCYLYTFCTTAFFGRYIAVVMLVLELAIITGSAKNIPDVE